MLLRREARRRGGQRMSRRAAPEESEKIERWLRDGYGPSIIAETLSIAEETVTAIAQEMHKAGEKVRLK